MVQLIWNGVGLTVPDGWEPASLERDGMLLECDTRPVCELKWNVVQGTFSFEKHLKRLRKGHKGVEFQPVAEADTPAPWGEAVAELTRSGLRLQSFIWRTHVHKGIGVALHNPATGLAALVQFFMESNGDESVAAQALTSFRDYSAGKTVPWAMFGLSARVPAQFRLETFSFKPGRYTVKFWRAKSARQDSRLPAGKGPGTRLTFERWAPASVLLKGTDLETWTQASLEEAPTGLPFSSEGDRVSWKGVEKTSFLRKALRREMHSRGRVWTTPQGNAILSVVAAGVIPAPEEIFNEIATSYELV